MLQAAEPLCVQLESLNVSVPRPPSPVAARQSPQWSREVPAEPSTWVCVHKRSEPVTVFPVSAKLIGARSDPSVKLVQFAAICVPSTNLYGPVDWTKRVLGEAVLSESHAL